MRITMEAKVCGNGSGITETFGVRGMNEKSFVGAKVHSLTLEAQ